MAPASDKETEEEAEERKSRYGQQRKEHEQEQEQRAQQRQREDELELRRYEVVDVKREKLTKDRVAQFDRNLEHAPAMFSSAQLRVFLRALSNIDPTASRTTLPNTSSPNPPTARTTRPRKKFC
jgi:ParB family chromosome partitioning protein